MMHLGLTRAERLAYQAALLRPYKLQVRVRMKNLDGDDLSELTTRLLDGQVNIDTSQATSRQASLTISDPHHSLHMDSDSPGAGALYVDRMIRIDYRIYVQALDRWVSCPIFTGPVTGMNRNGADVELSCLGKEYLAQNAPWRPLNFKKGHDVVDAIRTILRERAGETRFDFPDLNRRLPPPGLSLGRMQPTPWAAAHRLARSIDRQLYYDGAGICRLRNPPDAPVYTFRDGTAGPPRRDGAVLSDPQVEFDLSGVKNTIWVVGGKPRGKQNAKQPVTATVTAPRNHPLSPWRLGRNNVPRYLVERIENDHIRRREGATNLANRRLNQALIEGVTVSFDALPIPHLEPADRVRLDTEETSVTFILRQASIPLTHEGSMSVGINKRVTPTFRRHRPRGRR